MINIGMPMWWRSGGGAVDPLAPGVPTLVDLATASDTGSSSTDDITSSTTPDIIVDFATSPLQNDVIDVKDNGVVISSHTVTAGEAGGANITLGLTLAEGVHVIQVRHTRSGHSSAYSSGLTVTVDTTAPTISTASTANNAENSVLAIALAANETVTWALTGGADQARFEISGTTLRWAANGTKDFEAPNDADTNNTYIVQVTATDPAGNATNKTITVTVTDVDDTAPTISSLSFTSAAGADNTYIAGDVVQVTVVFSETVLVAGGTPTITLVCGASNKTASYASGSGSSSLVFSYTVQAGDNDTDGLAVTANTLALGGGTIKDAAGNNATLTHAAITNNASHKVDTTAPTVTTFTPLDNATGVSVSNNLTVLFSENVAFNSVVSIVLKKGSDNSTIQTFTQADIGGAISISSATLTINPTSDLASTTDYYVQIGTTSILDLAGNPYAGITNTTTWNWTTGSGASPTTVFDPTLSSANTLNFNGYTIVEVAAAGDLTSATATQVRLTIKFSLLANGTTVQAYIGQKAAAGDAYDFGTAVQLTFSGNGTITGDGSTLSYVSDFVNLPEAYDNSKNYLVAIQSLSGNIQVWNTSTSSTANGYYLGSNDAATLNKTAYATYANAHYIDKIEVQ